MGRQNPGIAAEREGPLMSQPLTQQEGYALGYLYGGDRDVRIECHSAQWVVTRHTQRCFSVLHKGNDLIPAGTRTIVERAKVDGYFRSCYTCKNCIRLAAKEM
jgi:hypothetical protein